MRASRGSAVLALLASSAHAFSDSSPFLLASTSQYTHKPDQPQLQTSSQVLEQTRAFLLSCPTENYLLVSQPGVNAADLKGSDGRCGLPNLCGAISSPSIKSQFSVAEVLGLVEGELLKKYIRAACSHKNKDVNVNEMKLAPLHGKSRANRLAENDRTLAQRFEDLRALGSYTIIYFSGAAEPAYEAEFNDPLHTELKRQTGMAPVRRKEPNSTVDNRPLFEKYQFFSPGIFMALFVTIVLLSILTVGLKALASLEVSYGAFEKEMGPAAQKKQM